ncbi:MAG: hypothetical protein H0W68_05535 [Gemmatimonadaceae bacterium]|nr:hypothetical protein [Gemmatimonadaceae bacterium]
MPSHPPSDHDPLAAFELPPDVMSNTLEHAISDDASLSHERGHSVASALQRKLKGSSVEYAFPGIVTAHLRSGAVARCGGPSLGWLVDVERANGETETLDVSVPDDAAPKEIADLFAKALKKF